MKINRSNFRLLLIATGSIILASCGSESKNDEIKDDKKEEPKMEEKVNSDGKPLFPLVNAAGSDSVDAEGNIVYGTADQLDFGVNDEVVPQVDSVSGREYTLGPRPVNPLPNVYGDDSIGADGNFVYPARDTNWISE
tara:strand:+ start:68782 stop:69192 length:411 start_codon:yes stop_codon:yes gene_type:complete